MTVRRFFKGIRNLIVAFFAISILWVIALRFIPVYFTPLMIIRNIEQIVDNVPLKTEHKWIPLNQISTHLIQAVVASEDNRFFTHNGFDFEQIQKARKENKKGKRLRGASTITQQTAKNVFLWQGRSYFRKGLEAYFTLLIECFWGKERIMEVYLNSIEMGRGIYGAEAVARKHFNKQAYQLSTKESALIAASLPNPIRFNSAKPSTYMYKRQSQIIDLMSKIGKIELGYGSIQTKTKTKIQKRR